MTRLGDVVVGLVLLGVDASVLAYVFPIHERLYAWPFYVLAGFGFLVLLALLVAFAFLFGLWGRETPEEEYDAPLEEV